ncbi:MAG: phytanoyl-CoA dioxygenase family protein [Nitrospira sp.]|nr:MAG: phytanoyl-CoA dioxygenase family protein [Nitrospira sp.]
MAHDLTNQLDRDGIVILPEFVAGPQLRGMQQAFEARLRHMAWNDTIGYERTEMYRHMIQDVLILDQGFLDVALHPLVLQVLQEYIGPQFQLVEAKGWLSLPTKKNFHGWHGDAWYDQHTVSTIPREVKLAIYLTDVRSGAFTYIKGSHRKQHPRLVQSHELSQVPRERIMEVPGTAGSAVLFDTSGIHRQATPVLEPRQAVFLNYHDPSIPLQQEDIEYYRYHPLLLNAAFLGNLTPEGQRVLGFGDKRNYQHGFERRRRHVFLEGISRSLLESSLQINQALYYPRRALAKARNLLRH